MKIKNIKPVLKKSASIIKTEGVGQFSKRGAKYVYRRYSPARITSEYRDILFINGCSLPHPSRYRVDHQMEQLRAAGMTVDSVYFEDLSMDSLKYYRGFVFFRCPVTDTVREFIKIAKQRNKTCFYDIDDLVINTKFTDLIQYVQTMKAEDRALYDDGVNRMEETLKLCDYAITTTEVLSDELKKYDKEVYINRNVASDEMVAHSLSALKTVERDKNKVVIGYFSGSITHNEDFEMVLPSLIRLLDKHNNLYIKIAGILDIPPVFQKYKDRIIPVEFMDWRKMPNEMAACDINIAPLTDSIFNAAKSENKWTEASLVKVVTVASNVGAFKKVISDTETGVLVDNTEAEWFSKLDELIGNSDKRQKIANNAYKKVLDDHTTIGNCLGITDFINNKLSRNVAFILPSTDISGGVNVILKHAEILQNNGWDVTLIDSISKNALKKSQKQYNYRLEIPGFSVVTEFKTKMEAHFDTVVATLWSTVPHARKYSNVKNRLYFVQNFETDFYPPGATELRLLANSTYCDDADLRYITMSLWCQEWLKEKFNKEARYCSNGLTVENYKFVERDFSKQKIKILIEGDSSSEYKNTDEAFKIVNKLDPEKFEVSYLSYRKEPKDWYRVDRFYNRIDPEKVGEVYASCDILLKTSLLESFSYPPLEMMATGGVSVVVPNGGNKEYLRDGFNCLFYEQGNIEDGVSKVLQVLSDKTLREKLIKNGRATAEKYAWKNIEKQVLAVYI